MKTLIIVVFTFLSISSYAQDMQKYLSETQEMVTQKKYQEALERYIWFQDHSLEHDMAMTGVRLSYALSSWKSLADIYPPAMTAFKGMRDNKTREILDSNAASQLFGDVAALNRVLGEDSKTIELFETLTKSHPNDAKRSWYWVKDALFNAKRYDIIRNYIGNPLNEFALLKSQYDMMNTFTKDDKKQQDALKSFNDNNLVEKSLQLIQFSIAVNDLKSAKEIRKKAMKIVKDNRLRDVEINKS